MTGHRIGIYTVVRVYKEGLSAEQITEEFPSLPLDLVKKVLAYYQENRVEVDAYVDAYRAELQRQEADYRPGPGTIRIRKLMEQIHQADEKHKDDPEWGALCIIEKLRRIQSENPTERI